jgi:hypothetical protein
MDNENLGFEHQTSRYFIDQGLEMIIHGNYGATASGQAGKRKSWVRAESAGAEAASACD